MYSSAPLCYTFMLHLHLFPNIIYQLTLYYIHSTYHVTIRQYHLTLFHFTSLQLNVFHFINKNHDFILLYSISLYSSALSCLHILYSYTNNTPTTTVFTFVYLSCMKILHLMIACSTSYFIP